MTTSPADASRPAGSQREVRYEHTREFPAILAQVWLLRSTPRIAARAETPLVMSFADQRAAKKSSTSTSTQVRLSSQRPQ